MMFTTYYQSGPDTLERNTGVIMAKMLLLLAFKKQKQCFSTISGAGK